MSRSLGVQQCDNSAKELRLQIIRDTVCNAAQRVVKAVERLPLYTATGVYWEEDACMTFYGRKYYIQLWYRRP